MPGIDGQPSRDCTSRRRRCPVSIDVILDPCTTIVAFLSVLPVPSSDGRRANPDGLVLRRAARRGAMTARQTERLCNLMARIIILRDTRRAHYNPLTATHARYAAFAALLVAAATVVVAPDPVANRTGRSTAAIRAATKFSPLTDVNPSTVSHGSRVAWEWTPREKALEAFGTRPGQLPGDAADDRQRALPEHARTTASSR